MGQRLIIEFVKDGQFVAALSETKFQFSDCEDLFDAV